MNCNIDITELNSCLHSHNIESQVTGLKEAKRVIDAVVEAAVQGLNITENVPIFSDWLSRIGPIIVPELEKAYQRATNKEVRTTTAILLLHFGSRLGLSDVIGALSADNPDQFVAAAKLAAAGVSEAAQPILNLLRIYVTDKPLKDSLAPSIAALIAALEKLKISIPIDIRDRMTAPGVSQFISALVPK